MILLEDIELLAVYNMEVLQNIEQTALVPTVGIPDSTTRLSAEKNVGLRDATMDNVSIAQGAANAAANTSGCVKGTSSC